MDAPAQAPHIPVLLDPILSAIPPNGVWLDGTFGAGGYTRGLLDAGVQKVYGIDRDPEVFERAKPWAKDYGDRLALVSGEFGRLDALAPEPLDGVVLDIGVSSMQLDQAERGFSFQKDGPLDMRMSQNGPSAADLVNSLSEAELADILFQYGEERASRRLAKAIVAARPMTTTGALADAITQTLPKSKPGQPHPATRTFQALRIAVNDELGQLIDGLYAAERALKPGGLLVVVTFHSLEDRIVKRFIQARSGQTASANRYAPEAQRDAATFERVTRKAITADADELAQNPRARSAKLRIAKRLDAPAPPVDMTGLGLPKLTLKGRL